MNNYQTPNYNNINSANKQNNKVSFIIIVLIIIGVCVFGYFKFIKSSDDHKQNNNQQTNETENESNEDSTSNNSTGPVDPDTNLTYDKTGAFLMPIEEVSTITGRIERGTVSVGDTIQIIGLDNEIITTTVESIETFRELLDTAESGDYVIISLKDITRDQVERGQVLAKPNSIVAATKFEADIYVLTKEEGGRHTPFFSDYRPQFYFRTTDITGVITLPNGVEMVNPGENIKLTIELVSPVAMENGTEFSIRESGRTIGKGTVTKVY